MRLVRLIIIVLCTSAAIQLNASSVIIKLDEGRILVAADNRMGFAVGSSSRSADDQCKIRSFGGTVATVSGAVLHWENSTKLGWDAISDAQKAYQLTGEDTTGLARTWVKLLTEQIGLYARSDPDFIHDLGLSPGEIVCGGYFVRWTFGTPIVLMEWVVPERNRIQANEYGKLPTNGVEQSTNKTTEELIGGKTSRAKAVARKWISVSQRYPERERSWRHLEFLIRETSKLDPTVSPSSDVLEITASNKLIWHRKSSCH